MPNPGTSLLFASDCILTELQREIVDVFTGDRTLQDATFTFFLHAYRHDGALLRVRFFSGLWSPAHWAWVGWLSCPWEWTQSAHPGPWMWVKAAAAKRLGVGGVFCLLVVIV